jgi:hypothetical protein
MADVVDVHTRLRVVNEFPTAESSTPTDNHRHMRSVCDKDVTDVISDAGSIGLKTVKRTMATAPTVTDQPQQWQ